MSHEPPRPRRRLPRKQKAHHEAGHAFAAVWSCIDTDSATIIPNLDEGVDGCVVTEGCSPDDSDERREAYATMCYAGHAAVCVFFGKRMDAWEEHGAGGDWSHALEVLGEHRADLQDRAVALIEEHRDDVARMAEALLKQGTLTEAQLDWIRLHPVLRAGNPYPQG